jgi:MFS family permease
VAAAGVAGFWLRSGRHPLPVVEPALLRVRAFAWSNVTAVLFSVAFAAGLLAIVLWLQQVWGYSALRTGLAIAPGPLMVPVFAAVSQRVAHRVTPGALAAVGCALFAVGTAWFALAAGPEPEYAAEVLPGWLVGGVGVGFALPTIMSAATADLPPARSATGSAVVTMARQVGLVLGVSVFVAVVGTPTSYAEVHDAFSSAWWVIAAVALFAAVTSAGMTPRREPA